MNEKTRQRIDTIFMPRSVAVIGASHREYRASYHVVKGLRERGFQGAVYPVNPGLENLQGLAVYGSVADIPGPVDLAYIAVPADQVPGALEECGRKGVHAAIIYSSGFSETGEAGARREREALAVARRHDISFIGPNCIGVADSFSRNTYYSDVPLAPGRSSLISHSGSLCGSITRMGHERGISFARTASLGNRADLSTGDFLEYLGEDERTGIIALYLESIDEGTRFLDALLSINRRKPVLVWKAGRTTAGSTAAASHTGALAGDHAVLRAAFAQSRVVECRGIEELLDYALMFQPPWRASGNRLGIVSSPGGVAVAAADACDENGLTLARYAKETVDQLSAIVPAFGSPRNPVDLTTQVFFDLELYTKAVDLVMADPGVDIVLIVAPAEMHPEEFARLVLRCRDHWPKPFAVSLTVSLGIFSIEQSIMREAPIPLYPTVERAVRALSAFVGWHRSAQVSSGDGGRAADEGPFARPSPAAPVSTKARRVFDELASSGKVLLCEHDAKRFLGQCGIPVTRETPASSIEEAVRLAPGIGFPLVLKAMVDGVAHKSDRGLVRCGVGSPGELADALAAMEKGIAGQGLAEGFRCWLLQEMIDVSHELIVGIKRDRTFGPVVVFGAGGIAVEVMRDVALRIAPFGPETAREMIRSVNAYALLKGFRGRAGIDMEALADVLVRVSTIASAFPRIGEMDINPLAAAHGGRLVVVDALIRIDSAPVITD